MLDGREGGGEVDSSITRGGGAGTADALRGKGKKERNGSNHWCPHPLANDDGFHCDPVRP